MGSLTKMATGASQILVGPQIPRPSSSDVSTLNSVAHTELNSVLTTMNNGTPPDPSMLQQMIAELVRKQNPFDSSSIEIVDGEARPLSRESFFIALVAVAVVAQDIDGNGTVELEEFLQWSIRNKEANGAEQQLRSVFDVFDKNKDGFIDTSELTQVRGRRPLIRSSHSLSHRAAAGLIAIAGDGRDGRTAVGRGDRGNDAHTRPRQ